MRGRGERRVVTYQVVRLFVALKRSKLDLPIAPSQRMTRVAVASESATDALGDE